MLESILAAAKIPGKQARFPDPPPVTYAVWMDDITADGPDGQNRIFTHDVTIELYEPEQDSASELSLEAQLNARGLHWIKQDRYWLDSVKRYQTVYEFSYIEKI